MQGTARAVFLHCSLVFFCLAQRFRIAFQLGMMLQSLLKPVDIPLRPRNIHCLTAYLANQLRFLQPPLLFLLIKYRIDAAVRIVGVPAQVINILLLFVRFSDGYAAIRDCRLRGALGMAVIA
ncbi:Uncharacterised protein [Yersinia ruckeri]|nr:Uncharacterised protein [Yersinia ruckeri]